MAKTVKLDANGYRKFGIMDRLAYAAGDFGCNMSFALKGTVSVFWTQYMQVSLEAMAILMMIVIGSKLLNQASRKAKLY